MGRKQTARARIDASGERLKESESLAVHCSDRKLCVFRALSIVLPRALRLLCGPDSTGGCGQCIASQRLRS